MRYTHILILLPTVILVSCSNESSNVESPSGIVEKSGSGEIWSVPTNWCDCIAFSTDGSLIAVADHRYIDTENTRSVYGRLRLRDTQTGKLVRTLGERTSECDALAFSTDGTVLAATFSFPSEIQLWQVVTGKAIASLPGHEEGTSALAFLPDGQTIISTGYDKTIRFTNWKTKNLEATLPLEEIGNCLTVSGNGQLLAVGAGDAGDDDLKHPSIAVYELPSKQRRFLIEIDDADEARQILKFSMDGTRLFEFAGDNDRDVIFVTVRNSANGKIEKTLELKGVGFVFAGAVSPNGRTVFTGGHDHALLSAVKTGKTIQMIPGHRSVFAADISRDGKHLVTVGHETIKLWPLEE